MEYLHILQKAKDEISSVEPEDREYLKKRLAILCCKNLYYFLKPILANIIK